MGQPQRTEQSSHSISLLGLPLCGQPPSTRQGELRALASVLTEPRGHRSYGACSRGMFSRCHCTCVRRYLVFHAEHRFAAYNQARREMGWKSAVNDNGARLDTGTAQKASQGFNAPTTNLSCPRCGGSAAATSENGEHRCHRTQPRFQQIPKSEMR